MTERIPVPSGHAPRLDQFGHPDLEEVTVAERESDVAWISMDAEDTMPVKK